MLYCAVHPLLRKNSGPTSVKDDHEGCWGTANDDIGNAVKCGRGCLGMFKYGWGWQGIIVLIAVWVPSQSLLTAVAIYFTRAGSLWEYMMWLGSIYSIYSHTWRLYVPKLRKIICEMPWCTYQLFMTTPFFASGSKKICSPWKQDSYAWKLLVTAVFEDDHLWMTFRLREWVF